MMKNINSIPAKMSGVLMGSQIVHSALPQYPVGPFQCAYLPELKFVLGSTQL